jgi:hypothetical protein
MVILIHMRELVHVVLVFVVEVLESSDKITMLDDQIMELIDLLLLI